MTSIYLDHNATTPVHPDVLEAMLPYFREEFGNPSSTHSKGRAARVQIDDARERVAELIGAQSQEIVFTSGGTESDNLAVLGAARALVNKGRHIVTCEVEHPAVRNACLQLKQEGFSVENVPVDRYGRVEIEALKALLRDDTVLVTLQHANSEVGSLQPIQSIGELCREQGVLFHTDAVQSVGKVDIDLQTLPVDMLSMSSHKIYGPKGVGALFVRRGVPPLSPLISGGGQEKKKRGGTENVPGIVGFGKASQLARDTLPQEAQRQRVLKDRIRETVVEEISGAAFYGHPEDCLPNTLNLGFEGVEGQALMIRLDLEGIFVSTGSACSSGSPLPSDVLVAMGVPDDKTQQTLRVSLGRGNSEDDVNRFLETLKRLVQDIRQKTSVPS